MRNARARLRTRQTAQHAVKGEAATTQGGRIAPMSNAQRVVIGLSGGVDSAVAAALLKDAGYDVHALFMRNWDEDEDGYCTAAADLQDARRVCDDLGIPLHTVNFARDYRDRVFEHFLAELRAGRTPNPDVACNREIKFGVCFEHARRLGADWFATGHYARTASVDGKPRLLRAADVGKDQTYFLHTVPGEMLARTLFPVGGLPQDRRAAHRARASVAGARQARQHRHLLHRRAALRGVPRPLPARAARLHRNDRRACDRRASRADVLHAGSAPGAGGRRRPGRGRGAVVRGCEGSRAQRSGRHAAARRSAIDVPRIRHRGGALDRRSAARDARSPAR